MGCHAGGHLNAVESPGAVATESEEKKIQVEQSVAMVQFHIDCSVDSWSRWRVAMDFFHELGRHIATATAEPRLQCGCTARYNAV